jgi:hypothetical protein
MIHVSMRPGGPDLATIQFVAEQEPDACGRWQARRGSAEEGTARNLLAARRRRQQRWRWRRSRAHRLSEWEPSRLWKTHSITPYESLQHSGSSSNLHGLQMILVT